MEKRYILKAEFDSVLKIGSAKNSLLAAGCNEESIGVLSFIDGKENLKVVSTTKASLLASRLFFVGLILGLVIYLFTIFSRENALVDRIVDLSLWDTISAASVGASALFLLGYIVGKNFQTHRLKFSKERSKKDFFLLSLEDTYDNVQKYIELLEKNNPIRVNVIDKHKEVELGLRTQ